MSRVLFERAPALCEAIIQQSEKPTQAELWAQKPAAERTSHDYFCAAAEWSRAWDDDWDGRHPEEAGALEE